MTKPKRPAAKRVRKPRDYRLAAFSSLSGLPFVLSTGYLDARRCRRMAAWLLKAALYLEQEKRK